MNALTQFLLGTVAPKIVDRVVARLMRGHKPDDISFFVLVSERDRNKARQLANVARARAAVEVARRRQRR